MNGRKRDEMCGELTRQRILGQWPPDYPKPGGPTLWRWLNQAVSAGLLHCAGSGRRSDPFRYWLPAHAKAVKARQAERKREHEEMKETFEDIMEQLRARGVGCEE